VTPAEPPVGDDGLAHALLAALPDAVVGVDRAGVIVFANAAAERLLGHPPGGLVGQPFTRLVPERMREEYVGGFSQFLTTGGVTKGTRQRVLARADGTEIAVDLTANAPPDGTAVLVVVVRPAHEAEVEQRLAAIVESSDDAIIGKTLDGIITTWNPAAERIYGYASDEILGRHISALSPPDQPDEIPSLLERIARGEHIDPYDTVRRRKDGALVDVSVCISPTHDATGEIVGASAIARDVSEQRRVLRQLEFLSDASKRLSSLDYSAQIDELARIAVPEIADWCVVFALSDDGATIAPRAWRHVDEAQAAVLAAHRQTSTAEVDDDVLMTPVLMPNARDNLMADARFEHLASVISSVDTRSAMIVPLIARGRVLGTLVLGHQRRAYERTDLVLATELGERAALALDNAWLFRERSTVARTLQASLLPPHLPTIAGLDLAARFYPGREGLDVGGDFYDVFPLPRGEWGIAIGDVCGTGAEAATITALLRYTLRGLAMQEPSPGRALEMLNEVLLREREGERFCTVAYLRLRRRQASARIVLSCAGHPAPMLIDRRGRVGAVPNAGTLLGVFPDIEVTDHELDLRPGSTLVLFTDGVLEARGEHDRFGTERVEEVLAGSVGRSADDVADALTGAVLEFGQGRVADDVAVLVIRYPQAVAASLAS
jgi:PAS domain S-box-containing protein